MAAAKVHIGRRRSKSRFLFFLTILLCSWTLLLVDISFSSSSATTITTAAYVSAFQIKFPPLKRRPQQHQHSTFDINNKQLKTLIKLKQQENQDSNNIIDPTPSSDTGNVDADDFPNSNEIRRYFDPNLIRYRCRVAYDGTGFVGFQIQQQKPLAEGKKFRFQKRTVQNELEIVLSKRFNRPIRVVGAGRTDAGVHARGQAVHFDLSLEESNSLLLREEENLKLMNSSIDSNDVDDDDGCDTTTIASRGSRNLPLLQTAMNRMLPSDVRVWNVQMAPEPCIETIGKLQRNNSLENNLNNSNGNQDIKKTSIATVDRPPPPPPRSKQGIYAWNVMQKATGKLYSYRICISDSMDPILRHSRWQIPDRPQEIDPIMLQKILKTYEGTHDFVCFAGAIEQNQRKSGRIISTIRTVHTINLIIENEGLGLYRIDIYLDGALYKMVRNLVGTAIDVCLGRLSITQFQQLLNFGKGRGDETTTNSTTTTKSGRKRNPCKPAPPQGLTLERVYYDEDNELF